MTTIHVFPGQGSQAVGMGQGLFDAFPEYVAQADEQLGYSIEKLCLEDPEENLVNTQYTQPALYVVNALTYFKQMQDAGKPDFVAGHSLGEYNALLAAECFDFITGLKLVQKRGDLMSEVKNGGMIAVIGLEIATIRAVIKEKGLDSIDIANLNALSQTVLAGTVDDTVAAIPVFEEAGAKMVVQLKVSGAFHSRYMAPVEGEFTNYLSRFELKAPTIPVISNYTARPYEADKMLQTLAAQISNSIRWTESIQYLLQQDEPEFLELGPGKVLTGLIRRIEKGK